VENPNTAYHAELLAFGGLYAQLHERQFRGELAG
jgi:hypothetical protein